MVKRPPMATGVGQLCSARLNLALLPGGHRKCEAQARDRFKDLASVTASDCCGACFLHDSSELFCADAWYIRILTDGTMAGQAPGRGMILHRARDAFSASVEGRDRPEPRRKTISRW